VNPDHIKHVNYFALAAALLVADTALKIFKRKASKR